MCREVHCSEGTTPTCDGCEHERPKLLPTNRETWFLWRRVQTQRIVTMGATVGIDYNAMFTVARILAIPVDMKRLHDIQLLEQIMVEEVNKNGGKQSHSG